MIIKRRFVPFCDLYLSDEESRKVLDYAINSVNKDEKEHLIEYYTKYKISQFNADTGACIPNFSYIISEFNKLDKTSPYDNGFTLEDVSDVQLIGMDDDNITLRLTTSSYGEEYTVAVINVKEGIKSQKLKLSSDRNCVWNVINNK